MMLPALQTIAQANQLAFFYGEYQAFNVAVDQIERSQLVLYHEGYIGGPINEDQQGSFEWNYNVKLYLLLQSELTDTPVFRRPGFEQLEPLAEKILTALKNDFILSNIYSDNNINLTSRNMDGISLKLNAKSKYVADYLC